jgi:hypothetical protein
MLVKLFLYYIGSDSNLGHFISNIDLLLILIALGSALGVYFITDIKEYECLVRDEEYDLSRRISQVGVTRLIVIIYIYYIYFKHHTQCMYYVV